MQTQTKIRSAWATNPPMPAMAAATSTPPAPAVTGAKPASTVKLAEWRLDPGRHTLTVAGPHMRPAGLFRRLTLHALPRPVEKRGVAQVDAVKKAQRQNAVMYQVCSPRKSS